MSGLSRQIGARLRSARKAAGYTSARVFAERLQIPGSTYSQHETGKRSLNVETLLRYSTLLQVNPGWLLTGVGDPHRGPYPDNDTRAKLQQESSMFSELNNSAQQALPALQNPHSDNYLQLFARLLQAVTSIMVDYNIQPAQQTLHQFCLELCQCLTRFLSAENQGITDPTVQQAGSDVTEER